MEKIYVAGGCFWGVQKWMKKLNINSTSVGYAQSNKFNPSYEEVCAELTGAVEAVEIIFNPEVITVTDILEHLFRVIDPFSKNRQGNDIGSQYRTGVYVSNKDQKIEAEDFVKRFNINNSYKTIYFEIEEIRNYYLAEEYHQDYLDKNPNGYCHIKM
jgi:methionine-S-sulfoxide reductase